MEATIQANVKQALLGKVLGTGWSEGLRKRGPELPLWDSAPQWLRKGSQVNISKTGSTDSQSSDDIQNIYQLGLAQALTSGATDQGLVVLLVVHGAPASPVATERRTQEAVTPGATAAPSSAGLRGAWLVAVVAW